MFGRALVIDDQPYHIESMQQSKSLMHDYLFVGDTRTALYVLYEYDINHSLDVIVCNANLPNSDVFEFVRAVKHESHLNNIPLLCYCVTADLGVQNLQMVAETLGADELIACNQFDGETVCHEIERWLAHGRCFEPPTGMGGLDDFASP
jgi:response regulator RpfG family c-di-GMP phosphodiesterase